MWTRKIPDAYWNRTGGTNSAYLWSKRADGKTRLNKESVVFTIVFVAVLFLIFLGTIGVI